MIKIKDHFLVKNGFAFKSDDFIKSGIPLIKIKNITENSVNLSFTNMDYLPNSYLNDHSSFLVKQNDILIALSGATLGKFALYDNPQASLLNQRVALIRPLNNDVNIKYLYYYLFQIIDSIKSKEKGGAQANISTTDIEGTEIFLPSIEVQNKIVNSLDKIQSLIELRKKTIRIVDEITQSVFLDMFGENKKEWKQGTFNDAILTTQYGLPKSLTREKTDFPILRMNNITYDGKLDLKDLKWIKLNSKESSVYELKKGDLLFNRTNSRELVGKTAIWDRDEKFYFAGYLVRIKLKKSANPYFINAFLNSHYGKKMLFNYAKASGNQCNFSPPLLKKQFLFIPPIDLQNKFEKKIKVVEKQKLKLVANLETLEMLFKSYLQIAFLKNTSKEKTELHKYLNDMFLQQELFGKITTQDFQLKNEYDRAKEILFDLLESGESKISQTCENNEKIQIQIS
ncbi:restriction endonuclease subunit S [Flavobacterium saccharophilum]|uniref:Type I restriction enzyme, S subunit n=1 Tax=Flavobacterium saccharophilum TaxID=29534 RepID=A0A1M7FLU4_9FLAO|nr:restriction endonuclease subunit S [Flavobacterium saccharophilum]SHM04718.1 type I restriction enzyme, S subunit [Flavobacterium saccharophilum]